MKNRYAFVLLVLLFASTLSVAQVTVKFQKPASWTAVSLYAWISGAPEPLGGWPGVALTETDGWYSYTFDASFTGANLIFNNNGKQTVSFPTTLSVCLKATDPVSPATEFGLTAVPCTAPGITVSFQKPAAWASVSLYAYYDLNGTNMQPLGGWPGASLTESNGVYSYTFDATITGVNIIYNQSGSPQTAGAWVTANSCFTSDGSSLTVVDCATITAVNNGKEKSLKFYPNPIVDKLNFNSSSTIDRVSIYSITGKSIMTDTQLSKNGALDVKSLKPGVYFVSIYFADGKQQFEKIVKR